jgi:hypothetical protein
MEPFEIIDGKKRWFSPNQLLHKMSISTFRKCDHHTYIHLREKGESVHYIAKKLGISPDLMDAIARMFHSDYRVLTEENKQRIWQLYMYEKKTPSEIAEWLNTTEWTILEIIEQWARDVMQNPKKYELIIPKVEFLTFNYLKDAYVERRMTIKKISEATGNKEGIIKQTLANMNLSKKYNTPEKHSYPFITKDGYRLIMVDGRVYKEHKYVWEQINGPIPKGMHVHHINLDKLDNRIENLDLLSKNHHALLHAKLNAEGRGLVVAQNAHMVILSNLKLKYSSEIKYKQKEEERKAREEEYRTEREERMKSLAEKGMVEENKVIDVGLG